MTARRIPVIITRAQPGADETARRVAALGADPVLSPVLSMVAIEPADVPPLSSLSGLVFTSANGVRAFQERSTDRSLTAWCVGPATAKAARQAGFGDVQESAGNAEDLAAFIADRSEPAPAPLLHVANSAAKGDLKAGLERRGFTVVFTALYEMVPAADLSPDCRALLASDAPAIVLIHSAMGATRFSELCADQSLASSAFISISSAAGAPLDVLDMQSRRTAAAPNEDALMVELAQAIATLSA